MNLKPSVRKILAIALLAIFIPLQLIVVGIFLYSLFSNDLNKPFSAPAFSFMMGIFVFPLWLAFSLLKSSHEAKKV